MRFNIKLSPYGILGSLVVFTFFCIRVDRYFLSLTDVSWVQCLYAALPPKHDFIITYWTGSPWSVLSEETEAQESHL